MSAGLVRCSVLQDELEEEVVVRVLDCDSISQVRYILIIYIVKLRVRVRVNIKRQT